MFKRLTVVLSVLALLLLAVPGVSAQGTVRTQSFTSAVNPYAMHVPVGWTHSTPTVSVYNVDAWVNPATTKGFHTNLIVARFPATYGDTDASFLQANELIALHSWHNVATLGTVRVSGHLLTIMSVSRSDGSGDLQAYLIRGGYLWIFNLAAYTTTQNAWLPVFRQVFGSFSTGAA